MLLQMCSNSNKNNTPTVHCCYLQGDVKLPPTQDMMAEIAQKEIAMSQRYVSSKRHTIQIDYIPFMDELAILTGNKPSVGMTVFYIYIIRLFKWHIRSYKRLYRICHLAYYNNCMFLMFI